ncbi:MAG: hypothetical protein JKY94_02395 [Rhodobacteraceae bacterium]|nr:hypothetical protein [Paracoccaceae bacterium]
MGNNRKLWNLGRRLKTASTKFCISLISALGILSFALTANANPQAPSCKADVGELGERLRLEHHPRGVKIWRLDLQRRDRFDQPLYRYTLKNRRNCWLVLEGVHVFMSARGDLGPLDLLPNTKRYADKFEEGANATRSMHKKWRKIAENKCKRKSDELIMYENTYEKVTEKEDCKQGVTVGLLAESSLIAFYVGDVQHGWRINLDVYSGLLWGAVAYAREDHTGPLFFDVDLSGE